MLKKASYMMIVPCLVSMAWACSKEPQPKAPGTNPEDMSAEGHADAAANEEQKAAEHHEMSEKAAEEPGHQGQQQYEHEQEAEKHKDIAEQHRKAGEKAADAGSAPKK